MNDLILALTLLSIFIPCYVYIGYPLLLIILDRVNSKPAINRQDISPSVSLFVSCYNEADVIRSKIENCLAIDYPAELIEFIFISDGSDDGTDEIIKEYADQGIKLVRQEGRLGKTSAITLTMPLATGEIIVFSDANAMYQTDAIKKIVRSFNDGTVGYVVGAALYSNADESAAAESENSYWRYEIFMKNIESRLHSVVGGDGAIYAIRKSLFIPLEADDINDFVNPLQIIAQGYRGIFDEEAICHEEAAGSFAKEARRKERIVNRSFNGLMKVKTVMNPFKFGFFSLEVISHKLLRWLIPVFILGTGLGSIYLSLQGYKSFQALVVLEVIFFWLAMIGNNLSNNEEIPPQFFYPYYFLMVNFYSLKGIIQALKGNIQITWSSPRQKTETDSNNNLAYRLSYSALLLFTSALFIQSIYGLLSA